MIDNRSRSWPTQAVGIGYLLLLPASTICTLDFMWSPLFGAGMFDAAFDLHGWGLLLAPFALLPLLAGHRRHGKRLPLALGIPGAMGLLVHTILDQSAAVPFPFFLWEVAGRLGASLLMAGLLLNATSLVRWTSRRRQNLERATLEA